jgi:hypothetical protein
MDLAASLKIGRTRKLAIKREVFFPVHRGEGLKRGEHT